MRIASVALGLGGLVDRTKQLAQSLTDGFAAWP